MAKEDYKDHVKNVSNVSKHKRMANTSKHRNTAYCIIIIMRYYVRGGLAARARGDELAAVRVLLGQQTANLFAGSPAQGMGDGG